MNQVFVDPTGQVSARVIAHSISAITGIEMITFEWEFPRIILAEVNTHNALSKNASSSRAIPVNTMLDQVRNNPAMPVRFGAANSGMQDKGVHNEPVFTIDYRFEQGKWLSPEDAWKSAAQFAAEKAEEFYEAGYAKQICNRLIEPFQRMKQVVSATDLENFFWLRDHHMADPTIEALAKVAKQARAASRPVVLQPGEWHVPYYNDGSWIPCHELVTSIDDFTPSGVFVDKFGHSLEHALAISSSCCAQTSFRSLDDTLEKASRVVSRLNLNGEEPDQPVHASPVEHQATPIKETVVFDNGNAVNYAALPSSWEKGITHMTRDGEFRSGNLNGFIQRRQLVPNHVKRG